MPKQLFQFMLQHYVYLRNLTQEQRKKMGFYKPQNYKKSKFTDPPIVNINL